MALDRTYGKNFDMKKLLLKENLLLRDTVVSFILITLFYTEYSRFCMETH